MTAQMRSWTWLHWAAAVVAAVATAVAVGVPTGIIDTPFYTRMTPVLWWNYPVWLATAALEGLVVGTFVRPPVRSDTGGRKAISGGFVSFLAVGCPICNKVVVLLLGVGGALSFFAPLQPYLAVASLALIAVALRQRLRYAAACPIPSAGSATVL